MRRKKWDQAPPAEGAYSKQSGLRKGQTKTLSAQSAGASHGVERVPYLNPDAFSRFIGPKNWGQALINDELTTCLLDNGAQLNFIAYASHIMTETEQRYHSNKQEFLALKWAVTEQFHEYLSPYGKNRNEFVVQTDNNPLTYIFSLANLDAAGQRWVAQLASYNFALEYQKGKDNTVADFLSRLDDRLPPGKVQDYLNKIPYPGVKAVLDNAITPLTERAEQGVRPNPDIQKAGQEVTVGARPARLATTNITNWKLEQQEDPVLYQVVNHRKAS